MRIHVQNTEQDDAFTVTPEQVAQAGARHGLDGHAASFGRTADELARGLADADVLVAPVDVLARHRPLPANRLRTVFALAAGLDRLAPFDWLPPGARLWNNSGIHGAKAGEFAMMAVAMLAMRLPDFIAAQRERRWTPIYTPTLRGRRVAVVGLGDIGGAVAAQARRAGLAVTGVRRMAGGTAAPNPDCEAVVAVDRLDAVLAHADCLVLCCPLTPATRGLMSRARLSLLPAGAGVVNLGRGALLDPDALCDLLDAGHLGGAVLDVFDPEPPPDGSRVWTTDRLIVTPHVSADDPLRYAAASLDVLFGNLRAEADGRPPRRPFDPALGY